MIFINNAKKAFFFALFVCSETYSMDFDKFKNDLSVPEKNTIASSCILESFKNEAKTVDTTIHIAKGQHIRPAEDVLKAPTIPLCIPIKCDPKFLNFVRDFYLMFDTSADRKGVITKLNVLRTGPMHIEDIDIALETVSKTFPEGLSFSTSHDVMDSLRIIREIRNIIKVSKYIPIKIQMLGFMPQRFEAARKAGIPDEDKYIIAIKDVDTSGEKADVLKRFDDLRGEIHREAINKTLSVLDILGKVKLKLDASIRKNLWESVVPGIRIAAEFFIKNIINGGTAEEKFISSEDIVSILDEGRGKPQIVSTRKYIPISYKDFMMACMSSELAGSPPARNVVIKTVVSKELGLMYLSTFFPEPL